MYFKESILAQLNNFSFGDVSKFASKMVMINGDKINAKAFMMFFNYYLYPQKTIRCFTKETRAVNAVTSYI